MTCEGLEENQLIKKALQGDSSALATLLRSHYSFLYKYLMKLTLQPTLAEDLTQETMLRCIEKIHLYQGSAKFSSWLISMATNLYTDTLRQGKREKNWRTAEQSLQAIRWENGHRDFYWSERLEAVSNLAYEVRLPILLKHYYGYSYEEIAEIIHIPIGTVKSRIHNGLHKLRKEWLADEQK